MLLKVLPYMGVAAIKSRDLGGLNMFLFPPPLEALHYIWLQLPRWLLKICLNCQHVRVLGQRSKDVHDRFYSQIFIILLR